MELTISRQTAENLTVNRQKGQSLPSTGLNVYSLHVGAFQKKFWISGRVAWSTDLTSASKLYQDTQQNSWRVENIINFF